MSARRDESGAVTVEVAFAVPVLMAVVLAALAVIWLAFLQASATEAAREGARYGSLALRWGDQGKPDVAQIAADMARRVPQLHLTAADVQITYPGCPGACSTPPAQGPFSVTVRTKPLPSPFKGFAMVAHATGEGHAE